MTNNRGIQTGDVVKSAAGHDKDKIFAVIGTENGFALLCNGKDRKAQKPKRKKLKHIKKTGIRLAWISETPEKVNNTSVRKALTTAARSLTEPAEN